MDWKIAVLFGGSAAGSVPHWSPAHVCWYGSDKLTPPHSGNRSRLFTAGWLLLRRILYAHQHYRLTWSVFFLCVLLIKYKKTYQFTSCKSDVVTHAKQHKSFFWDNLLFWMCDLIALTWCCKLISFLYLIFAVLLANVYKGLSVNLMLNVNFTNLSTASIVKKGKS